MSESAPADKSDPDHGELSRWGAAPILAAATIQGLALWALTVANRDDTWAEHHPASYYATRLVALLLPPVCYLVAPWIRRARTWALLGGLGLLLALLGLHHGARVVGAEPAERRFADDGPFILYAGAIILVFHLLPFMQAWLKTQRPWPRYPDLFDFAWRNGIVLALTAAISLVTWLLLFAWSTLFKTLGIPFFEIAFFNIREVWWYLFAVIGGASFALAESTSALHLTVRTLALTICKWIAVFAAILLVTFAVALVIRAYPLFAHHQRAISASWLLTLAIAMIYLYNAGYQDGTDREPYPIRLGQFIRWVAPLLIVVSALALFGLWVRIDQYGLTVSRVLGCILGSITALYGVGYTWATIRGRSWMGGLDQVNTVTAIVVMLVAIAVLTPTMTPYRLSAASMERRIRASLYDNKGDINEGPFYALRFDLGDYGRDRLRALKTLNAHPEQNAIRAAATEMMAMTFRSGVSKRLGAKEAELAPYPADSHLESALIAAIRADELQLCAQHRECVIHVLFPDLRTDGSPRAVALTPSAARVYREERGKWISATDLTIRTGNDCMSAATLTNLFQAGDLGTSTPAERQLRIGSRQYAYREEAGETDRAAGRCSCPPDLTDRCSGQGEQAEDDWDRP